MPGVPFSSTLASRRAVDSPVPALGQTAPGGESTPVMLTIQRRVPPAARPQPAGAGGQMHSRLSSSRSVVFHRSGLRRWRRRRCPWRLLHGIQHPLPDAQLRCSEAPGRCPEVSYGLGLHPLAELASFQRPRAKQFAPGNPASTLQAPPRDDTLALLLAFGSAQPGRRIYSDEVTRHATVHTVEAPGCEAGLPAKRPSGAEG